MSDSNKKYVIQTQVTEEEYKAFEFCLRYLPNGKLCERAKLVYNRLLLSIKSAPQE